MPASPSCSTADGYPASPRTGDPITGIDVATAVNGVTVFHAGTARDEHGALRTAGGRVLNVTATGADLEVARTRAYEAAGLIKFEGMRYRNDIAAQAAAAQRRGELINRRRTPTVLTPVRRTTGGGGRVGNGRRRRRRPSPDANGTQRTRRRRAARRR